MIEHGFTPEHLQHAPEIAMGIMALAMAYTTKQRLWIRDRDNNACQAEALNIPHVCNGSCEINEEQRKLQVHHVIPQRYAEVVGIPDPDFAENGITLCEKFHQETIHPDMPVAKWKYRNGDKGAYKDTMRDRDAMMSRGAIYWNDQYDRQLRAQAVKNTQHHEGEDFPEKGAR